MINTKYLFIGKKEHGFGETDYLILYIGPLRICLTKSLYSYPRLVIWWGKPNLAKNIGIKKAFTLQVIKPYFM